MTKFYSVTLPVKPYIKKYVELVEGNPVQFKGTSMLCRIVRAYMENKNPTGLSAEQKRKAVALRTTYISILVPIAKMSVIGTEISEDGILQINAFLHDCFERAVHQYVRDNTKQTGRYKGNKAALEEFATTFGLELETDISYDGLKKIEWRHRSRSESLFSKIPAAL